MAVRFRYAVGKLEDQKLHYRNNCSNDQQQRRADDTSYYYFLNMVARSFLINNIVNISLLIRLIRTLKRQKMDGYDGRSTICRKISVACQHIPYLHELFYAERREFLFTFTNGNTYAVYTLPERWNVNYLHFPSPSVIFCFHVHGAKETFV